MYIISYNCKGLTEVKYPYINQLLQQSDILMLQEHWLFSNGITKMQSEFKSHNVFGKCGMTLAN